MPSEDWVARLIGSAGLAISGGSLWVSVHQFRRTGPQVVVDLRAGRYRTKTGDLDEVIDVMVRNTGRAPFTIEGLNFDTGPGLLTASYSEGPADPGHRLPMQLEGGGPSVLFQRRVRYTLQAGTESTTLRPSIRTSDGRTHRASSSVTLPITGGWTIG